MAFIALEGVKVFGLASFFPSAEKCITGIFYAVPRQAPVRGTWLEFQEPPLT